VRPKGETSNDREGQQIAGRARRAVKKGNGARPERNGKKSKSRQNIKRRSTRGSDSEVE